MHSGPYTSEGILSIANQWLEAEIKIPERGGYYHYFYCDCGKKLIVPEDMQVKESYSCPACHKSYSGPDQDGAVRYMQHRSLAGAVLALALVYGIEKDKAYAEKCAEILLKYASSYLVPRADDPAGGVFLQPLDEAVWIIPLAQAYDLIYYSRCMTDEEKQRIEQNLLRPAAQRLKYAGVAGVHGSWCLSAVGIVGMTVKDASFVQYALDSFKQQISEYLGDDGLWSTSAHEHHFYAMSAFIFLAEVCYRTGIDLYNWEMPSGKSLKAAFMAPLDYAYPCFRLPAIDDGWYDSVLPLDLYEIAYRRWNEPAFAWVLKKGYRFGDAPVNRLQIENTLKYTRSSFFAFLFGRDLPGRSGVPVLKSQDFRNLGVCTLRSVDDVMATFDYGPSGRHGHNDKLGFTFYANDTLLMPDYGTPGYGSGILGWYKSTAAHNTVIVDGAEQSGAVDYGLVYRCVGSFIQHAEAIAEDCYPGVAHSRKVLLVGNSLIVFDELKSDKEHDYDWIAHCEGTPENLKANNSESCNINISKYRYMEMESAHSFSDTLNLNWKCENGGLAFSIWTYSDESKVILGNCPAETNERRVSFLMCRQRGQNVHFMAALQPVRSGESVEVTKDGCMLKVGDHDVVDYIYMSGCGDDGVSSALDTDGEIAAVRAVNGEVAIVSLIKGSWIKWNGEMLLECPAPVDCVELLLEERSPVVKYSGDTAGIVKIRTNARAMRVNGQRAAATSSNGQALLRITPQMLTGDTFIARP